MEIQVAYFLTWYQSSQFRGYFFTLDAAARPSLDRSRRVGLFQIDFSLGRSSLGSAFPSPRPHTRSSLSLLSSDRSPQPSPPREARTTMLGLKPWSPHYPGLKPPASLVWRPHSDCLPAPTQLDDTTSHAHPPMLVCSHGSRPHPPTRALAYRHLFPRVPLFLLTCTPAAHPLPLLIDRP